MKEIKYPCQLMVEFNNEGEISVSAHYGIGAEGIEARRGLPLELSSAELTQLKNFVAKTVLPKVKTHERIVTAAS